MTIKSVVKALLPYGFVTRIYPRLKYTSLNRRKYRGYKPAGGFDAKMNIYIDYVRNNTNIKVQNIFELGANFAQDADYLMENFHLKPENVYVFEAHPEIFNVIKKIHSFNAFNYAVYNKTGDIEFNIHPLNHVDTG